MPAGTAILTLVSGPPGLAAAGPAAAGDAPGAAAAGDAAGLAAGEAWAAGAGAGAAGAGGAGAAGRPLQPATIRSSATAETNDLRMLTSPTHALAPVPRRNTTLVRVTVNIAASYGHVNRFKALLVPR